MSERKTKQIHIYLDDELKQAFAVFCKNRYSTTSQVVKEFIIKCVTSGK